MKRVLQGLVAAGLAAGAVNAAPAVGQLTVTVKVEDADTVDGCTVKALKPGVVRADASAVNSPLAEGAPAAALEVPVGKVDVLTDCTVDNVHYVQLDEGVKVAKATTHKVDLKKGSVIVHGMQGSTRVSKGEYVMSVAGTSVEAGRAPLGQRTYVAVGPYDLRVETEVEGEACTVWLPGQQVKEGRPQVIQADVSRGMLELLVLRNGKPGEGAGAITFPGQQNRIKEFGTAEPVAVSPGTYDVLASLESSFDFTEKRQRKVVVAPGKVTQVKLDMPRGTVTTRCELDGKEAHATVQGFVPGAAEFFNQAPCGQVLELSPGKYHFKLVLDAQKSGFKVLGDAPAPEVWHRNVVVKAGKDVAAVANWSPSRLFVKATKNGEPVEAAVTVSRSGGAVVGGGPSGQALPMSPGRYDVEVLFPSRRAPTREMVRGVECAAGKPCDVSVNIERAVLVIEAWRGEAQAADADVVVYKEGSEVPYIKGRSGDELELPPGVWLPEVRVNGKGKQVSKMRLKAAERETRRVEVE
jgi:hypothetical protein